MIGDIKNAKAIHLKGWLFLFLGSLSGAVLIAETLNVKTALLLVVCVWSFCRFYYYAFYVIEKYVDPQYKYTGLYSLMRYIIRRGKV